MRLLLFIFLLAPVLALSVPQPDPGATGTSDSAWADADFLAAREAFRIGDAVRFERYASRLTQSPLEPYITYYRLRMNLDSVDPGVIRAFLARGDESPVIDRLRGEWLKRLGEGGQWDTFDAEYPRLENPDNELACYALQSGLRSDWNRVMQETRQLWLSTGSSLPDSCGLLFDIAMKLVAINADDVWQRIRLALDAGNVTLAKALVAQGPERSGLSVKVLQNVTRNPRGYLEAVNWKRANATQHDIALYALAKLANQMPDLALTQWENISRYFQPTEWQKFYAMLGYEAARQQDGRALQWFDSAGDLPLDTEQMAWKTRAALRAQNWRAVLDCIDSMVPAQQQQDVWYYWKARALRAVGQLREATALFRALEGNYDFYGQLAANELGEHPARGSMFVSFVPDETALREMESRPSISRAIALYRMDLRTEAFREWVLAVRDFDDQQFLTAAEVARRHGMYDRAINTAERTTEEHDFNLRYLAPYRDKLEPYLSRNDLDEAWVYGLMRQESRFVTVARSDAGARGIMQIMPATARWVARKMGMRHFRSSSLHEMDTNFELGTYYMKMVLDQFDGNQVLATAAYNAGPTRVRRWLGDMPLEAAIYIENIPLDETRGYVKKVMSNAVFYDELFGRSGPGLKQRLGVIAPRDDVSRLSVAEER